MNLPTNTQFLNSLYAFRAASEQATLAYYFEGCGHEATGFKIRAITELKKAVTALGYDLVEVVSTTAIDADGSNIEVAIPVQREPQSPEQLVNAMDDSANDMARRT